MLYQDKVSADFADKVQTISNQLGVNPDWLMYVMHNESAGTFSPAVKNPGSTATGLIQFLSGTDDTLGTSTTALAQMTATDQLDYVQKYFQGVINQYGPINSVSDTYLAVFYPAAIAWTDPQKKFSTTVYTQNKLFDYDKLGYLTKGDFEDYVNYHYSLVGGDTGSADSGERVTDDGSDTSDIPPVETGRYTNTQIVVFAGGAAIVTLLAILIFLFHKNKSHE